MTYAEMLRDPRWQKRRLEIFERDDWMCRCCESTDRELQVHHKRYWFGKKPWEYADEDLETLCERCHATQTQATRLIKAEIPKLGLGATSRVAGFAVAQRLENPESWSKEDRYVNLLDYEMAAGISAGIWSMVSVHVPIDKIIGLVQPSKLLDMDKLDELVDVERGIRKAGNGGR